MTLGVCVFWKESPVKTQSRASRPDNNVATDMYL